MPILEKYLELLGNPLLRLKYIYGQTLKSIYNNYVNPVAVPVRLSNLRKVTSTTADHV